MGNGERLSQVSVARGELTEVVAEERGNPRLVVGSPLSYAIAECTAHDVCISDERVDGLPIGPTADVLEGLWQFPVVEGDVRRDAVLEEFVDEAVVEGNTPRFNRPGSVRDDPGPRGGQVVCRDPRVGHERNVLGIPVIVVARDIAGFPVENAPGFVYESVPGRLTFAILVPRAFDLVRRCGHAPEKVSRKARGNCSCVDIHHPRNVGAAHTMRHPDAGPGVLVPTAPSA